MMNACQTPFRTARVRTSILSVLLLVLATLATLPGTASAALDGPYARQVQQMYVAYYGRPGDPGGVNYWAGRLAAEGGNWIADLVNAFGTSAEYTERFGDLSNEALIDNLYRQLFNREAEPAGRGFYIDLLGGTNHSGLNPSLRRSTLAQIALDIANGAQNEDLTILNNKLSLSSDFTRLIDLAGSRYQAPDIPDAVAMLAAVGADAKAATNRQAVAQYLIDSLLSMSAPPAPDVRFYRDLFGRVGNAQDDLALGNECVDQYLGVAGSAISLALPRSDESLLSGMRATLEISPNYCGARLLRYQLDNGPDGMSIDERAGTLRWVPPAASEGSVVTASVRVSDGELQGQASFQLKVAKPTPVAISTNADTVTVTQLGSLNGLAITLPPSATAATAATAEIQPAATPDSLGVYRVAATDAPPIPPHVTRLSDFFRVTPTLANDGEIRVRLPLIQPPEGYTPDGLALYVYTDQVTDVDGPVWVRIRRHLQFNQDGSLTIDLAGLGALSFIGVPPSARLTASGSAVLQAATGHGCITSTQATHSWIDHHSTCCQKTNFLGYPVKTDTKICTVTGNNSFEVTVEDFSQNQWDWEQTNNESHESIHTLIDWLYRAKNWFDRHDFGTDSDIEVSVEQLDSLIRECAPNCTGIGGYVTGSEDYDVLHLDLDSRWDEVDMKVTAVHEYFHHAQAHTKINGLDNLIRKGKGYKWLTEGTATWFEDEIFDSENSYTRKGSTIDLRLLKDGLNAPKNDYNSFAFWKLIDSRCGLTKHNRWRWLFNGDFVDSSGKDDPDPTGIRNLSARLVEWKCDFGTGAGIENRYKLETALLFYNFATMGVNVGPFRLDINGVVYNDPMGGDISLFDDNEVTKDGLPLCNKGDRFYCFREAWKLIPGNREFAFDKRSLDSAAAISYAIESAEIPLGKQAVVSVLSMYDIAEVALASDDANFIKPSDNLKLDGEQHGSFWSVPFAASSPQKSEYVYAQAPGPAPRAFLTVINPSLDKTIEIEVEVYFEDCTDPSCGAATYAWQTGMWGACSGECGTNKGTQTRTVTCQSNSGEIVADSKCTSPKPPTEQPCTASECPIDPPISPNSNWSAEANANGISKDLMITIYADPSVGTYETTLNSEWCGPVYSSGTVYVGPTTDGYTGITLIQTSDQERCDTDQGWWLQTDRKDSQTDYIVEPKGSSLEVLYASDCAIRFNGECVADFVQFVAPGNP